MVSWGHPSFRARQLAAWLYRRCAATFDEMTDLSRGLRSELATRCRSASARPVEEHESADGTRKVLLAFDDNSGVETVLLPYADRTAVCVSTQIGCAIGCPFCATGLSGFHRHLTAGEIVEQVRWAQRTTGRQVSHVVFMGMGEPLLNYAQTLKAAKLLTQEMGFGMRRLTISTVGIAPAIRRLAGERLQLTLAVSVHAPDDALRSQLVPVGGRYPLGELLEACGEYVSETGRRLTFEYVLLRGINDSPQQARALGRLARPLRAAVNLIPYNPVDAAPRFSRPGAAAVDAFRRALEDVGVAVTQRAERGTDIGGACGQLRRRQALRGGARRQGSVRPPTEACA
jgi:23S rRNA (adenine2503-C2)-methyltransferase